MSTPNPYRVSLAYRRASTRSKVAGEVRFIKDRGSDKGEWGWGTPGPSQREISENFIFNAKHLKPLAQILRSTLMALGHATSAHARLVKVKSRNVSPDGSLGGKGYIQKIPDMRRQLMNCIEVLSASSDTLYDELNAPHWHPDADIMSPRDREEVKEIVEDAEEIKEDPEGWAEEQEEEFEEEIEEKLDEEGVSDEIGGDPVEDEEDAGFLSPFGKTARIQNMDLFTQERRAVMALDNIQGRVDYLKKFLSTFRLGLKKIEDEGDLEDPRYLEILVKEASGISNELWGIWESLGKSTNRINRISPHRPPVFASSKNVASRFAEKKSV